MAVLCSKFFLTLCRDLNSERAEHNIFFIHSSQSIKWFIPYPVIHGIGMKTALPISKVLCGASTTAGGNDIRGRVHLTRPHEIRPQNFL